MKSLRSGIVSHTSLSASSSASGPAAVKHKDVQRGAEASDFLQPGEGRLRGNQVQSFAGIREFIGKTGADTSQRGKRKDKKQWAQAVPQEIMVGRKEKICHGKHG